VAPGAASSPAWRGWLWALLGGGLSALLLIVAFPRHGVPQAAYVALVPFLSWLYFARPSWRAVRWTSFLTGYAQWVVLLWWLRHFPEQVGLSMGWGYLGVFLLSAVLAVFWLAWGLFAAWGFRVLGRATVGWRLLLVLGLAGAWVLLEWVRSWLFTGFPWLPLAASQWDQQLVLQMVAVTGAWGLSFVLVLFNLGLTFYVPQFLRTSRQVWYKRFCAEFYLGLAGLFTAIGLGVGELSKAPDEVMFRAALVQPYITPPERWDVGGREALLTRFDYWLRQPTAFLEELRASGGEERPWFEELTPEVVFWPEASTPFPAPGSPFMEAWLEELVRETGVPVVMGNLVKVAGAEGEAAKFYNAVIAIDPERGIDPHFVAKRKLVPFGEEVPAWLPFIDKLVPVEASFERGTGHPVLPLRLGGRSWRIGPLVCYEDLFPALTREATRAGVDLFLVVTNDAWYGEEGAAYQHMTHSVLRAVETRRPVVRAGNAGWSGWIDERGYVRWVMRERESGSIYFADAEVGPIGRSTAFAGRETLYVRWGDWFVALSSLLAGGLLAALVGRVGTPSRG
jgi:apolipoprotein N-acyltransferase